MWFRVTNGRTSAANAYVLSDEGKAGFDPRHVVGVANARKMAELLGSSMGRSVTVSGHDAEGDFVLGVYEAGDLAGEASSPAVRRLYEESVRASTDMRDHLLASIPEDAIKGFASLVSSLGYVVAQHKKAKRGERPKISYPVLQRVFCGTTDFDSVSMPSFPATLALLSKRLMAEPGWTCLEDVSGLGHREQMAVVQTRPKKVRIDIDDNLQLSTPRSAFRTPPLGSGTCALVVMEAEKPFGAEETVDAIRVIYRPADEAEAVKLMGRLLDESNPYKNRVVLFGRKITTIRSRMSTKCWDDLVAHGHVKAEMDFLAASIRQREALADKGLSIKRGVLLSGPPGDGKSSAVECFVNSISGEATVIIVESMDQIRLVYDMALALAPSVVVLEDLDLITKNRASAYSGGWKDDVTGELLQTLSGGSACKDVITIATTNHPEEIDEALKKRAGRFDVHIRMGVPSDEERLQILAMYLQKFGVTEQFLTSKVRTLFSRETARLILVPAHIEEFVMSAAKRASVELRELNYADFERGIESMKSISSPRPS